MSSGTTGRAGGASDLAADLRDAYAAYERATERVTERGEETLEAVAEQHERLEALFSTYEERVKGDGDFAVFIEFQEEMAKFVEGLPEELPHHEAFEAVDDLMQQRRLTESDFTAARDRLAPVENDVARLEERDATQNRYRELRTRARKRARELGDEITDLEHLQNLGAADLDAPVERVGDPIEAYNEAVAEAFETFRREASARDVLDFVAATTAFPLVPFEAPPSDLREYVETHEAGTESIPQLLEYAEYSKSKLSHYVDDADALTRTVATNRTYLRRLDADPLTVALPPPPADHLRWRLRELVQVTGRFAPEDVVARLRELRSLPDRTEYGRLRESAVAREQVTDDQRERLASGAVADELEQLRATRAELRDALDSLPSV